MKEYLPQKSVILKISRFSLVTILVFSWIFSGWPQIWHNPPIPPEIQVAHAGSPIAYKSQGGGVATEVSGTNLTPAAPAAVDANDILIAHIVVLDATSALS